MFKDRYKNILIFVLYAFSNPRLFLIAFQCHLPTYIQLEWLKNWNIKTFLDVGAHEGQELHAISVLFPKIHVYAFEPQINLYEKLKKFSSENVIIVNSAVGEKDFETKLGVPHYSPAASILKPSHELSAEFGDFHLAPVSVVSLDNFFKNKKLVRPVAIKIDTQGYEINVLKGATKILSQIDILYVETPLSKMYVDSALFGEIYTFLTQRGFRYYGTIPDSQFWPNFSLPTAQNSVFIRDSSYSKRFKK